MNIDVVGRIRPSIRGEGPSSHVVDSNNRMANRPGGTYFTFPTLHRQDASNADVFRSTVTPLLDLLVAGYNACLVVTGESGAGKTFTLAGEGGHNAGGLVQMLLDQLFHRVEKDGRAFYDNHLDSNKVTLQMYEIYNELIKDLLVVPGLQADYLDVDESAEKGAFVRNLKTATVSTPNEGAGLFRQGLGRRTDAQTDFGPARDHAAVVINIDLSLKTADNPLPNKSRFTVVLTPGLEKLRDDSTQLRLREGPTLSKGVVCLGQVVASLANQPHADRVVNYTDSRLTYLLRDQLGGNCKTRVLMCFPPQADVDTVGPALSLATQLSQVKNFPVINDPLTQSLLCQYRAKILNLQQQLGLGGGLGSLGAGLGETGHLHDVRDELRREKTENLALRDKNERLHLQIDQMQNNFGSLATTKTDLSAQLLMTEEEKLKISKTLVEMQIDNNKLKEEVEAAKFDLTNKILQLENRVLEADVERDKHAKAAKNYRERLGELERDRKDLADEYVTLKTNYLALSGAHEREVSKNEELSIELLNLVNAKVALMRQLDGRESVTDATDEEVNRIRAIIARYKMTPNLKTTKEDRDNVEKSLFGDQTRFQNQIDRLKNQYDGTQKFIEGKMTAQTKQIKNLRDQVREKQKSVSELNAQLITMRNSNETLQLQNNRLQHKVKDVTDDFKSRLVKYVQDISHFVDKELGKKDVAKMRKYVDDMIKDLRRAYKVREEQLSTAAQKYKRSLDSTTRRHEELLVAYRELREQVEALGLDDVDLGPDETSLQMTDADLHSKQQREINRLRGDLSQAETESESLKIRLRMEDHKPKTTGKQAKKSRDDDNWETLQKQLRAFTANTQQELEQERAELLSRNAMLDQQVSELQEYIDSHLTRYKEEIVRLRHKLGIGETGGFSTPPLRR